MSRSSYTDAQKAEAVELAVEVGKAEASRRLGINAGTIGSWCSRAGVATVAAELMAEARDQIRLTREVRRERLAERLLEVAEMSTERAVELMPDANLRDVVGLFTRAIHDHQLLTGAATARTEVSEPTREAEVLLDELDARRKRKVA